VKNRKQHSDKKPSTQAPQSAAPEPYKIGPSTPFDFAGKNLTPYGGLHPVATLLEKLGFQALVEAMITVHRITRVMGIYQFVLVLLCYKKQICCIMILWDVLPRQAHSRNALRPTLTAWRRPQGTPTASRR